MGGSTVGSKRRSSVAAALLLALALAGCGDDGGGDDITVARDGGPDGGGSRAGGGGRNAGGRGAESGRGSIDGGAAGAGSGGSAGSSATNMCDPGVEPEVRCGGEECPGIPAGAAQCTLSCCVGGQCGTRNTGSSARTCEALARESPQCPDYTGLNASGDPVMLVGCCTQGGQCGVVSQLHRTCIVTSSSVVLPAVPKSCDPNATEEDAGVDRDAGG